MEDDNPWGTHVSPVVDLEGGSNVWASSDDEPDHVENDPDAVVQQVQASFQDNDDDENLELESSFQIETEVEKTIGVDSNPWDSVVEVNNTFRSDADEVPTADEISVAPIKAIRPNTETTNITEEKDTLQTEPEIELEQNLNAESQDVKDVKDENEEEEDDDDFGDFDEAEAVQVIIPDINFPQDFKTSLQSIIPGTFNPPQLSKTESSILEHGHARKYNNILNGRNRQFVPSDANLKTANNFYNKNYIKSSSIHKHVGDIAKEWRSIEKGLLSEETTGLKNHSRKLFNWSTSKGKEANSDEGSQVHAQSNSNKAQVNQRLLKAAATKARAIVEERTEKERLHALKLQKEQRERVKRLELARQKREELTKKYEAPVVESTDNKKTFLGRIFGKKSKIAADSFSHDKLKGEKSPGPDNEESTDADDDDFDLHALAFSSGNQGDEDNDDEDLDDLTGGEVFGYNELVVDETQVDERQEDPEVDIFDKETEPASVMTPLSVSRKASEATIKETLPEDASEKKKSSVLPALPPITDSECTKETLTDDGAPGDADKKTIAKEQGIVESQEQIDDNEEEEDDEFDEFVASPIATPEPMNETTSIFDVPLSTPSNDLLTSLTQGMVPLKPTEKLTNMASISSSSKSGDLNNDKLLDVISSLSSTQISQSSSFETKLDSTSPEDLNVLNSLASSETANYSLNKSNETVPAESTDNHEEDEWGDFAAADPVIKPTMLKQYNIQQLEPSSNVHHKPPNRTPSRTPSRIPSRTPSTKRVPSKQYVDIDLPESLVPSASSMLNERAFHNTTIIGGGDSFSRSGSIHRKGSMKRAGSIKKKAPEVNLIDL